MLEALYRLQHGACAYDGRATALLLPQVREFAADLLGPKDHLRFATIDHVWPRALGGNNGPANIVLASAYSNRWKDCKKPEGVWVPRFKHVPKEVLAEIALVEQLRWAEATRLAGCEKLAKWEILRKLVREELNKLAVDFKFYEPLYRVVA